MNKEKEIEELAEVVTEVQIHLPDNYGMTYSRPLAKWIIEAGYRKADEVQKETEKDIISAVLEGGFSTITEGDCLNFRQGYDVEEIHNFMIMLAKQYGVEVDE